ncbi:hypothetical protein GI374_00025 [Paracoccus sp. S-4012]|uniref:hypothetical protein n=1 Tax=Paracoccus sp. S-4012 TaxID=2665648 RepID=UPI0012B0A075|nr:hypothetical protein [Paracoccus sp. S-4012]MRX48849.1 hypothetical protein [Paracoccus sp. S-4012]
MPRLGGRKAVVSEGNESRPSRNGAEQPLKITGYLGVILDAEASLVLQGAALPCALKPRQRGAHLLEPLGPQLVDISPARFEEGWAGGGAIEQSLKSDMMFRTEARWGHRERAP